METLIWMGFLGVVAIMLLIWMTHTVYKRIMNWRRKGD